MKGIIEHDLSVLAGKQKLLHWQVRVDGLVQGVGFRPFVYRLAHELGVRGWVGSDAAGVVMDIYGSEAVLRELCGRLSREGPPLAQIASVTVAAEDWVSGDDVPKAFRIAESQSQGQSFMAVGADVATCSECLMELFDPANRRYRYPFTNCTNCGPRYTILLGLPYDRASTTMARFVMCEECRAEYEDPSNRRFHAQPNACPRCGPRLEWKNPQGEVESFGEEALMRAVRELRAGRVVAIKGLGGYHLAVDATLETAVMRLRERKMRDAKPFAVMVKDLATAEKICKVDEQARGALLSKGRPIVIMPKSDDVTLARSVAPGLDEVGIFLPYTPLHHLLMHEVDGPIVLTSGNLTDEPIVYKDDDAVERLGPLVDGILSNDREIYTRCDDSVMRATGGAGQLLRRSRGYAPEAVFLKRALARNVLALGGELKVTVSVGKDNRIYSSQHIGDLDHLAIEESYLMAINHMVELCGARPQVVVRDMHPQYRSSLIAERFGLEVVEVQHHHAHVASCLVEHGLEGPVVGLAMDGMGYGIDGGIWGGEVLVADLNGFKRKGHLMEVPFVSGDKASREPWRMALLWLYLLGGSDLVQEVGWQLDGRWQRMLSVLEQVVGQGHGGGLMRVTSSCGRLFDAVSALLGICANSTYEGQAAMLLEAAATREASRECKAYEIDVRDETGEVVIDPRPLLAQVLQDWRRGVVVGVIAASFHESLGQGLAKAAATVAEREGIDKVALTGGVFQNRRLSMIVRHALRREGLDVLEHRMVPANDGGLSVGQAAIGGTLR